MIELVIFDWDDVFTLGSTEGYNKCYHEALNAVDVHLSPDEESRRIKSKWGSGHAAQLQDLLQERPDLVPEAIAQYENHFFGNTFVDCLSIVPGTQEFLENIAKDYRLAVATGGHPEVLKNRVIPKFHIPDVFEQIVTIYDIDDIAHAKPHPYMLNKILETAGVSADHAVMVGDAKNDVLMGQNAGVTPIVVLTGQLSRNQAEELNVEHIIDDVTQLGSVLKSLN
jgi:HAD superfamily hydrolase (TIGR01509 family)